MAGNIDFRNRIDTFLAWNNQVVTHAKVKLKKKKRRNAVFKNIRNMLITVRPPNATAKRSEARKDIDLDMEIAVPSLLQNNWIFIGFLAISNFILED